MVHGEATAPCILDLGNMEQLACPVANYYERKRICSPECQSHIRLTAVMSPASSIVFYSTASLRIIC